MKGIRQIFSNSPEWPDGLREMDALGAPRSLHTMGRPLDPKAQAIAIVGTRKPTAAGIEAARDLTKGLVEAGYCIVSGLAVGIDAVAHRTALEQGGKTVAVLGCGVDIAYPLKNARLQQRIASLGTLISEYPEGCPPRRHQFPARNRIIAGLTVGVIVVEGGAKSGALITARHALDANRSVFAVPGSYRNPAAFGPNELIRRCLATPVTDIQHVFDELSPGEIWSREAAAPGQIGLSAEELEVLAILDDTVLTSDYIAAHVDLAPGLTGRSLSRLELRGFAVRRNGGYEITRTGAKARGASSLV